MNKTRILTITSILICITILTACSALFGVEPIAYIHTARENPALEQDDARPGQDDTPVDFSPPTRRAPAESLIVTTLTSVEMAEFEAAHAVTPAQERYLAFGAFLPTVNRESPRVFALESVTEAQAAHNMSSAWSIVDGETALVQIRGLVSASGQSPVADDIWHTLVRNGRFEPLCGETMFFEGADLTGLENVYASTVGRAQGRADEFEALMFLIEAYDIGLDREEAFELFVLMLLAERVNSGLEAFHVAGQLLIDAFEFTHEELMSIPTLAAWDYGRAVHVARQSVTAGFLEEEDVWVYLQKAANSAAGIYNCWREYTAAYVIGRALAFGNNSLDMIAAFDFLLHHYASPFLTIDFN